MQYRGRENYSNCDTKLEVETLRNKLETLKSNDVCVHHEGSQMRNMGSSPSGFSQEDLLNKYENHVPLQPRFVMA